MEVIEKIRFLNLRNLSDQIISLKPSINCIFGENGNGKTNVLEGIYLTINKKSFRKKAAFQQILSVDCGKAEIITNLTTVKNDELEYYSTIWNSRSFSCFKNNSEKIKKPKLNCVFVSPFDSFSFHNESSARRNLLDTFISRINPQYKTVLLEYNKLLKQKNHLLKYNTDHYQLDAIDKVISEKIVFISAKRDGFVKDINPYLEFIYKEIFSEEVNLSLEVSSLFKSLDPKETYSRLKNNRSIDIDSRVSKIGPHRDEISLKFNGFDSVDFCSLGQQKTAYLSLLFAYINLFGYKFRVFPIVLIDDVSGELDSIRLDLLINYLFKAEYQVVLTTANADFKNKLEDFGNINLINVKDGYFH